METSYDGWEINNHASSVGNPLLSERDGNIDLSYTLATALNIRRKPTTLWKRWKPILISLSGFIVSGSRKPTTLWKRWKQVERLRLSIVEKFLSETHYSLKEMETGQTPPRSEFQPFGSRKPTTLWKRWKRWTLRTSAIPFLISSETHYSLKEMETSFLLALTLLPSK